MAERTCDGCGVVILPGRRERNRRRWCSERCRVATYYSRRPEKADEQRRANRDRAAARYVPVSHRRTCSVCGATFDTKRPQARYCSPLCSGRQARRVRRARLRGVPVVDFDPVDVFDRDGWTCQLCGDPVDRARSYPDPLSASLDHRIPLADAGSHTPENTQLAHLRCNQSRGAKPLDPRPTRAPLPDTGA